MKRIVFCLLLVPWMAQGQLPTLVDTFPAPCGERFDYSHDPTGNPDPVGFKLISELPCLPVKVKIKHEAFIILDIIQTWVHGLNGWVKIQDSGWHDNLYVTVVDIPDWADDIIFISHNNLTHFTLWWFELECIYPPIEECCATVVTLAGPSLACPGDEVTITSHIGKGNPPFQYEWNTGEIDSFISAPVAKTKTFFLEVTDSFGCPGHASIKVFVPQPPVNFSDTLVCPGAFVSVPKDSGIVWQDDTLVQVFQDVILWGSIIDTLGCEHFVPLEINVQKQGYVSPDTTVCRFREMTLQATGSEQYMWMTLSGSIITDNNYLPVFVLTDTTFVVQSIDSLNCRWIDTVDINASYCIDHTNSFFPNVFEPGTADNPFNLYWQVFFESADIEIVSLVIWDRWGSKIREITSGEMLWDGNYASGKPAACGVYVWQIIVKTLEGNFVLSGDVTLIR